MPVLGHYGVHLPANARFARWLSAQWRTSRTLRVGPWLYNITFIRHAMTWSGRSRSTTDEWRGSSSRYNFIKLPELTESTRLTSRPPPNFVVLVAKFTLTPRSSLHQCRVASQIKRMASVSAGATHFNGFNTSKSLRSKGEGLMAFQKNLITKNIKVSYDFWISTSRKNTHGFSNPSWQIYFRMHFLSGF